MDGNVLETLYEIISDRKLNPKEGSYTNYLFNSGLDKVLKKIGEESSEVIIAAKNTDNPALTGEICDLLYHLSVLMSIKGITWDYIFDELIKRELKTGNLKEFHNKGEI